MQQYFLTRIILTGSGDSENSGKVAGSYYKQQNANHLQQPSLSTYSLFDTQTICTAGYSASPTHLPP